VNKEEFIHLAVKCGYAATPQGAKQYTEEHPKEDYDTGDFIAMHESSMHWNGIPSVKGLNGAWGIGKGCRTTAFSNGIAGNSGSHEDWGK
jgi:hypothetical protein